MVFIHYWRENNWMLTFLDVINATGYTNGIILDSNSGRHVYNLRLWILHHQRLIYMG